MKKTRIGVVGIGRGAMLIRYCRDAKNAELVAICDKWEEGLNRKKEEINDDKITYYTSFDEFLNHDMDVVFLANYATEHAPFAIRAMEKGMHVVSEVLPVQTMKEAVELVETVERTGKIYAYCENYCYMGAVREMKKLYREGKLGEFEYGEGEYMHNCEPIWPRITYGDKDHWRNNIYATFYCTHSIGPLLHITGLKPVKVTGFEMPFNKRCARMGAKSGHSGMEIITLENGAILKSIHGLGPSKDSIWYSIYGSMGRLESSREDAECGGVNRIYVNLDKEEGMSKNNVISYSPTDEIAEQGVGHGHGGSDYYALYQIFEKLAGNHDAETIDVYEALDMFLPGLFAYRSILNGGIPMEIPDLRDKKVRDRYRDDTECTDPRVAGDQLIPSYSKGNPEVPDGQYEIIKQKWLELLKK